MTVALVLDPRRLSAAEHLALRTALEAHGRRDARLGERAGEIARAFADAHPWDIDARLVAANVEVLAGRLDRAASWLEEHLVGVAVPTLLGARRRARDVQAKANLRDALRARNRIT
ncbi:MAG: hypothetical protein HY775_10210 [Acidobacteria bacterium]|nr:hypothetical protein [Acidobacteriota bacterium]